MKILWLINVAIPIISEKIGMAITYTGVWLSGAMEYPSNDYEIELAICFPAYDRKHYKGAVNRVGYYTYDAYNDKPDAS